MQPWVIRDRVKSGYLLIGRPFLSNDTYCIVPPHYVTDKVEGRFEKTIVIIMACFTGNDRVMAAAFFSKGASAYLGFKGLVSSRYTDVFTTRFLEKIYLERLSLEEAFKEVKAELGSDPYFDGEPALYLPK